MNDKELNDFLETWAIPIGLLVAAIGVCFVAFFLWIFKAIIS